MNMMTMYLLTRLDGLCVFFGVAYTISFISTFASFVFCNDDDLAEFAPRKKYSVIALAISVCGAILTPPTKQMAAIIVVPKIVNSTAVQKDVPELYSLGVEWLKDKLATESK